MKKKEIKTLTKTGMTICLGGLFLTGMKPCKRQRQSHLWYGIALIGFSVWHYNLNTPLLKRAPNVFRKK